jgi:hypothetical protein
MGRRENAFHIIKKLIDTDNGGSLSGDSGGNDAQGGGARDSLELL